MKIYQIALTWNGEKKKLDWEINDGIKVIKRGFKTRKEARLYVENTLSATYGK